MNPFLLSIVTVGELHSLTHQFGWGTAKKRALETLLGDFTWVDINNRAILLAYREIDAWSPSVGRTMGKNDVWIAATARVTNTTLLTTDRDFDHLHPANPTRSWQVDREWIDPTSNLP